MNELLLKRIERRLANLADDQGYQVLDYVEFLETKYGTEEREPTVFERVADGVEDAMRAGRLPVAAIRGTMSAVDTASRLMERLAAAGRSAVNELGKTVAAANPPPPPSERGADGERSSRPGGASPDRSSDPESKEPPTSA
jgi:hypothetical protein